MVADTDSPRVWKRRVFFCELEIKLSFDSMTISLKFWNDWIRICFVEHPFALLWNLNFRCFGIYIHSRFNRLSIIYLWFEVYLVHWTGFMHPGRDLCYIYTYLQKSISKVLTALQKLTMLNRFYLFRVRF